MQYLPLEDKIIEVDPETNVARVLVKADLQVELDRAKYNIQELEKMLAEKQAQVVPTTKVTPEQKKAIEQANLLLDIPNLEKQLQDFTDQKKKLETILKV